jgi:hypothetical protein
MPTEYIVTLLIAERDRVNQAIEALQGRTKRIGRPPGSKNAVTTNGATATKPAKKHTRTFTAAQRKAQSERLKAFWAKKRKQSAK